MDAERRPQEGRPGARRLRDISHLYISTGRRAGGLGAGSPALLPGHVPAARRRVWVAVAGPGPAASRSAVGADLAVQLARAGRRTLIVDLDPALPGVGFRLGLRARDSLAHLLSEEAPRVVRGFLGIRVLCGVAGRGTLGDAPGALRAALADIDCVLVQLPAVPEGAVLRELGALLPEQPGPTTLSRAAQQSPMIGAWLATAQRPAPAPEARPAPVDVALWIVDASRAEEGPPAALEQAVLVGPRRVLLGDAPPDASTTFWARVPPSPYASWLPVSLLDPEHPAARACEGFAQAVLAASARPQGAPHA